MRLAFLSVALGGLAVSAAPASAVDDHGDQMLPNVDVRQDQKVAPVAPRAADRLETTLGVEGFVESSPQTGAAAFVGRTDGFLTASSKKDPADIVLGYVSDQRRAFGLDGSDLANLQVTKSYTAIDGVTHVTFSQSVDGIESFDSYLRGNVAKNGRLINISGAPVSDLSVATTTPDLSADEALLAARENVGGDATVPPVEKRSQGPDRKTTYETYAESATLKVFAQAGQDQLVWDVQVLDSDSILYRVAVDAASGEVLFRQSLTAFDNNDAQVWPLHPDAGVTRTAVNFGTDPTWLNRSASDLHQLKGNNTHTYVDGGANGYQPGEEVVRNGGLAGNWTYPTQFFNQQPECPAFGCTWDSTNAASKATNRNPGAVGLFYLVNHFHDALLAAPIGFDEAAGNFEHVNASGQGLGGDAVLAEAQDSSGTNNANMSTPADGESPRMQMYLWDALYDVDASADAEIVYHEYTHGLSDRLVNLGGAQSGAMGEGWSDFYAQDLLVHEGDKTDPAGPGNLLMGVYALGAQGIREQGIDCTVGAANAQCPASGTAGSGGFTYGDLGKVNINTVHDNGEIWGQTMWDLRTALGRNDALKIITGGMRLSPASPSMLTMRDAIIQSAQVNNVNLSTVWSVFAARGMGYLATTPSADATTATEDFSLPPALLHVSTTVNDKAPRGDGDGFPEPGETLAVTTTVQNTTGSAIPSVTGSIAASNGAQVVVGTSNWPTVAAGKNAANDPAFTVKVPEAQACESTVDLTVSVNGPNGAVAVPVKTVNVGQPSFTNSTDVPKAIPDDAPAGVNSTLTLPGTGNVSDLDVRIGGLTHTYVGDLKITLTHAGTTVVLVDAAGGAADNFEDLVLDDEADQPITGSLLSAPGGLTGTYRPAESLSVFDGHSRSGAWLLNVRDNFPEDAGTLNSWGVSPARQCDVFRLPTSVTNAASAITTDVATLNGTHNSSGTPTDYQFEYGTSTSYGQKSPLTAGGAGNGAQPVTATASGLAPATQYHYRLIALRNGVVHSRGGDQVFTTSAPASALDTTAPSITVTKAPKKKTTTKKPKVKVKVTFRSEAGATFTCRVDKSKSKPCTPPFSTTVKAKPGKGMKHTIVIVATDQAGNASTPTAVKFTAVRKG